jgi:O-antigen ligase
MGSPRSGLELYTMPFDSYRCIRIIMLIILVVISMPMVLFDNDRIYSGAGIMYMIAYAFIAMLSSVYSSFKMLTLYKGFEVFAMVIVVMASGKYLKSKYDVQNYLGIIIVPLMVLSFSSLLGSFMIPNQAFQHGGTGNIMSLVLEGVAPMVNANTLTQIAGIVFVLLFNEYIRSNYITNKIIIFVLMIIFVLTAILAHSRTSLLSIILAVVFVLIRNGSVGTACIITCISFLFALIGPVRIMVVEFIYRGQNKIAFLSLSGRTEFWPIVWNEINKSPFVGHGYYAAQRIGLGVSSVDNTYLEVILGVGIIGLFIFVAGVICLSWSIYSLIKKDNVHGRDTLIYNIENQIGIIFIFLIIRSITGPSFQIFHINLILFLALQVMTAAMIRIKKLETNNL